MQSIDGGIVSQKMLSESPAAKRGWGLKEWPSSVSPSIRNAFVSEPFDEFSNFTQMFLSVRRCAQRMALLCGLKVKVTPGLLFKVMGFTLHFRVRSISPKHFGRFSLNLIQKFPSMRRCAEPMTRLRECHT